jgi:hypothetical protein
MESLKENCRQSEDVYAELLNRIRIGSHNSDDLEVLSKRVCGTVLIVNVRSLKTQQYCVQNMNTRMS